MGTVSLTLPSDGQTIDASDVNNPLNTLAAEINGQLDNSNIKTGAAIDRSKIAGFTDGWESLGYAPTTITALGNRSYTVVIPSVDTTTATSPGQRLKLPRTVTAPTYMGGAFNGTSHYFTKTSPSGSLGTITNNFTIMAIVEPTAYQDGVIASRSDSAGNNMIALQCASTGQIQLVIKNGGSGNFRYVTTSQSIPITKKTKVAGTSASGTMIIYIDDIAVPISAPATGGTAPTTAGTGGDFSIGRLGASSSLYFPGYISSVAVFSSVLSASTIKDYNNQALTGSETNCIGAWSLNNSGTDVGGSNNLTATGGVGYTARSPFTNSVTGTNVVAGTTNYGIIMAQTFSTNTTYTIQVPEGETLPTTGGIGPVSYSTQANPYGIPSTDSITRYSRSILNTSAPSLTNSSQDLASCGLVQIVTASEGAIAQVRVDLGIGSTTDFEFRPEVRLGGTVVKNYTPNATLASAGGRASTRGFTWNVPLVAGANTISAGVELNSSTGPILNIGAGAMTVTIVKGYGSGN